MAYFSKCQNNEHSHYGSLKKMYIKKEINFWKIVYRHEIPVISVAYKSCLILHAGHLILDHVTNKNINK